MAKRAPPLGTRRSSTSPFCRITGKSHSMDEHHYVPSPDDYPKFDNLRGCRITEKHDHFKDYKPFYPILDVDGATRTITEHDFHCRITAKYRAMAGHKYVYPVLGVGSEKKMEDMSFVDGDLLDVMVLPEVEHIIRGGIQDVLSLKEGEELFIYSKEKTIFPAALKEIPQKKACPRSKYNRRHTLPVSLEATALPGPEVKTIRDLKKKVVSEAPVFDVEPENVEVLMDVRKSRPKRPGKQKRKVTEGLTAKKRSRPEGVEKENVLENVIEEKLETPRLSRLERFKMQFAQFDTPTEKDSGNRLTLVGAFDENDVVELDFCEPMQVQGDQSSLGSINTTAEDSLSAVRPGSDVREPSEEYEDIVPNVINPVIQIPPTIMTYYISVLITGKEKPQTSQVVTTTLSNDETSTKLFSDQISEVVMSQKNDVDTLSADYVAESEDRESVPNCDGPGVLLKDDEDPPMSDCYEPLELGEFLQNDCGSEDALRKVSFRKNKDLSSWKSVDYLNELKNVPMTAQSEGFERSEAISFTHNLRNVRNSEECDKNTISFDRPTSFGNLKQCTEDTASLNDTPTYVSTDLQEYTDDTLLLRDIPTNVGYFQDGHGDALSLSHIPTKVDHFQECNKDTMSFNHILTNLGDDQQFNESTLSSNNNPTKVDHLEECNNNTICFKDTPTNGGHFQEHNGDAVCFRDIPN